MTELLTREDFEPYLGQAFSIEGLPFDLMLDKIESSDVPAPEGQRQSFSLIFKGPKPGPVLADGTYETTVADHAAFVLFLAPIDTRAGDRQDYQAVFN